jgi:hypothetical protein
MLIMGTSQHSMNQCATDYHDIAILSRNWQMCHSANELKKKLSLMKTTKHRLKGKRGKDEIMLNTPYNRP